MGAAWLVSEGAALAGKPGGGGGGGSSGEIYYTDGSRVFVMTDDGSGKSQLPSAVVSSDPSRARHGGKRFFLAQQLAMGEVNWRGQARYDLFAIDDGGVKVRLTDAVNHGNLRFLGGWCFCPDEDADSATISGLAHEMHVDGTAVAGSGGVYFGVVSWDAAGNISLQAAPALVSNAAGFRAAPAADYQPNIFRAPAVSPDMSKIAVDSHDQGNDIRLIDIATNTISTVLQEPASTDIREVSFLADGSRILFARGDSGTSDYIEKIAPDGTQRVAIYKSARNVTLGVPRSSPDSMHVLYTNYSTSGSGRWDVYRVSVSGGRATNLTADAGTTSNVGLAWR